KIEPATIPGTISGKTTVRNVFHPRAPRSEEPSSSDPGTRSSAAYIGRTTYGSHRYEKVIQTATFEYPTDQCTPILSNTHTSRPPGDGINRQAKMRTR